MARRTDRFALVDGAASPAFSRDGETIFHLRGGSMPQLWTMDRAGTNARPLVLLGEKVGFLRRSPVDDRVVFGIAAGGDERQQLWLWEDGSAGPLTEAGTVIHDFGCWSPDGSEFAYTANERDEAHLDVYLRAPGGAARRVFEGTHQLSAPAWHPSQRVLLLLADVAEGDQRLSLLQLDTGVAVDVPHSRPVAFKSVRWAKDGSHLLALSDGGGEFLSVCRIDPASGAVTPIVTADRADIEAWSASPDAARIAVVENDRGWSTLRVGLAGSRPGLVALPHGVVSDLAWSPDGAQLLFCFAGSTTPSGIMAWDSASGAVTAVWQPEGPAGMRTFELVDMPRRDGQSIPGWVARPAGTPPDAGWPAVVWVHGGPASQSRPTLRPDMQALLDQGIAVLMPNVRGSTGYGRTATASDDGPRRPGAVEDLADAHAWLARQPGIDGTRIGIMGQSYGGYMVLAALAAFPTLWKAAVDFYGIADFATLLANTGPWRRSHRSQEYAGGPDDTPEATALFGQISPIHRADRITAPLLVLHGTRDPRVPFDESEQIVEFLTERGQTVRFERFDYAGHGFIRPADRCRAFAAVSAFFREWL